MSELTSLAPTVAKERTQKEAVLPQTIRETNLLEVAVRFGVEVSYATPEAIRESLLRAGGFTVRSAEALIEESAAQKSRSQFERVKDSLNVVSSKENPGVIVLHGASACSLLLNFVYDFIIRNTGGPDRDNCRRFGHLLK